MMKTLIGRLVQAACVATALSGGAVFAADSKPENAQPPASSAHATAVAPTPGGAPDGVDAGKPRKAWSFTEAGRIPVQSGGRLKPLDSFARELVLFQTGSRSFQGWDPVDLLFAWITAPQVWENEAFIQVSREDVRKELGLDLTRTRFSPKELYQDSYLAQYAERLPQPQPGMPAPKQTPREQELRRLLDRLGSFRNIVSGEGWTVVPSQSDTNWKTLGGREPEGNLIRALYAEMLTAYLAKDQARFEKAAHMTRIAVQGTVPQWTESDELKMQAESIYNRTRPFLMAWILFLAGSLTWLGVIALKDGRARKGFRIASWAFTWTAMASLIVGFLLRCYVAGRPPVTNMYESILWVAFGVMVFALILYALHRQAVLMAVSCALATFCLIAADASPAMMDPGLHPLVPVLRSNYWLTIHVLTITLGYAAFALTLGLGNVTLFQYLRPRPGSVARISSLNQLTYRGMMFGVVLLAAGTILGGVWADYSWGRFWGWDPKEVWALIALLGYIAVLHARYTGWMGQFGFAAWTVISFSLVVMAWYGVNFVLGVGLHSYGFSSGGRGWVGSFLLAQFLYVGAAALAKRRSAPKKVNTPRAAEAVSS